MIDKKYVNIALIVVFFVSLFISLNSVIFETNFQLDQAIARVGEKEISRQRFEEIIKVLDDQSNSELTLEKKNLIRERLIDEELLIQRAIELDLVRNDSLVKGNVIQTMFQYIINSNELVEPSEAELREYFSKEKNYFSSGRRYKLKNYTFRNLNDAETAINLLNQSDLESFLKLVETESAIDLPNVFLTPQKIRDYLGPKVLDELPSLEKGGFSNIFEINEVPSIVICIDILLDNNPKFEEIAEQIKNKFIRDREDSLVKEYIENLRNFYEIEKYSF
ncbi:MAG: peptidyl-prolyl cis-trans isomerase [Gammaproteobacteria bacterium]|nr:MAG: peptidyl-prolyl cis-trans isomerase [Gammaproteobacteria bacterium]